MDDGGLMILNIEDQAFVGHDLEWQLSRMLGRAAPGVHRRLLAEIALR
ncbi:MAG: hypothetical protein Q8S00_24615 [Deltaproteobacteria bacterium]|nr:hypothetical protein [Deltaproteobacteria bacterium]MDZ4341055.1 hypothetical protein [Candidatus Binatia bacterium]